MVKTADSQASTMVSITIKDVNDEPPTFNKHEYTVQIVENVPSGTPLPNMDMVVEDTDVVSISFLSQNLEKNVTSFHCLFFNFSRDPTPSLEYLLLIHQAYFPSNLPLQRGRLLSASELRRVFWIMKIQIRGSSSSWYKLDFISFAIFTDLLGCFNIARFVSVYIGCCQGIIHKSEAQFHCYCHGEYRGC